MSNHPPAETLDALKLIENLRFALDEAAVVNIVDSNRQLVYVNDKFCQTFKYNREELIGQVWDFIDPRYHSADFIHQLQEAMRLNQVWHGDLYATAKDGLPVWLDTTIVPFLNPDGTFQQRISICYDITSRKQAELQAERNAQQLATVAQVSAVIASELDPVQVVQLVVDLTKERFNLYHAHVYRLDKEQNSLFLVAGYGEPGRKMRESSFSIPYNRKHSLVARAAREKTAVIVNDVTREPDFLPNPQLPKTRSELAVPLIFGDDVLGVLDIQSEQADFFTAQDAVIQSALAAQIAVALQNAREYEKSQQLLEYNQSLLSNVGDGLIVVTIPDGHIITYNKVMAEMLGYTFDEFKFANLFELTPPEWVSTTRQATERLATYGAMPPFEKEYFKKDGSRIPVRLTTSLLRLPNGQMQSVTLVANLTEQQQVQRIADRLANVITALTEATNDDQMVTALLLALDSTENVAIDLSYLVTNQANQLTEMRSVANWPISENNTTGRTYPLQRSPYYPIWRDSTDQVYMIEDLPNYADHNQDLSAAATTSKSVVLLPIRYGGIWQGIVSYTWTIPHSFSRTEQAVFSGMADTLAAVISNRRALLVSEDARAEAASLYSISAAINTAQNEKELARLIAERFGHSETNQVNILLWADSQYDEPMVLNVGSWAPPGEPDLTGVLLQKSAIPSLAGLERDRPVWSNDVRAESRLDETARNVLAQLNIRSFINIPLNAADRWIGMLNLNSNKVHATDEREIRLLGNVANQLAVVLERIRLQKQESEAREETERLYKISERINRALTPQDLVDAVMPYVQYPGIVQVSVGLWDSGNFDTSTQVHTVGAWVPEGVPSSVGRRTPISSIPTLKALSREHVTFGDDLWNDPNMDPLTIETMRKIGIRAFSFAPLIVNGIWIGTFGIYGGQQHTHTPKETRLLGTIASQVATALERIRLQQQTERRASDLATVAQVSVATTTELNVTRLLNSLVELAKQRFALYHAHVYLFDPERKTLLLAAGAGDAGRQMLAAGFNISFNRQRSLVARAAREKQGVIVNDVRRAPDFLPNPLLPETRAELAVPLLVGDELIGVFDVQSDIAGRFNEEDLLIHSTLAGQIAIAVKNARQYEAQVHVAEQLREVDRLKSEFLASMSHELRTPLNSIIGFSEVLADGLDGDLPEEAQIDVQAIHESGLHLLELINDILDLAKIEAGHMELDLTNVSLATVVEEVERTTRGLLKDKPLQVHFAISHDLPLVKADTKRLRQILKNLVSNAIKFTKEGQITISAEPTADGQFVQVNVQDTGMGIAPDNLDMVFEQFRQVKSDSTREIGGTGLGLPITRELVQMHNGKIWVTSTLGVGSTFSFTVPQTN